MQRNLILPKGPANADIMFIIDSATADDEAAGYVFSGKYASTIKSLCSESKIKYDNTYRTAYYKQRLEYKGKNVKQRRQAVASAKHEHDYDGILQNEIVQLKPRVIVPLGELSFQYVALQKSLSKFRGSILPLRQDFQSQCLPHIVRVVPTLPPEFLQSSPISRTYISLDYEKIYKASITSGPIESNILVWIAATAESLLNYIQRIPAGAPGVFDIETRFNIPVCIGFCFSNREAVCVPLIDETVSIGEQTVLWKIVDKLLRERVWVNQNIKFDTLVLERFGFKINNVSGDTALRQSIIYPELPKNLGFLNSIYNDIPYFKDEGKDNPNREQLYLYCAKDCVSTYQIYKKQIQDLEDLGLQNFERKVQSLFWPYIRLERRGILIDQNRLTVLRCKYDVLYEYNLGALRALCGNPHLNPASPQQIATLVFNELGYPMRKDKKTGQPSTGEEILEELYTFQQCKNRLGRQILELIIGCRKLHKIIEYCSTPIHTDGRMRCSYDLGGTKTGRSSAKATTDYLIEKAEGRFVLSSIGHSLQTIGKHGFKIGGEWYGKDLRSIFVPTPDFIFVEGDLSQAEARVDAVLATDFDFLKQFDIKPGVHCLTASWIYGCKPENIIKGTEQYHIGKTVRHAGERNMGPDRLASMLSQYEVTPKECQKILLKFHETQPSIRKVFHKDIIDFVSNNRYLVSPHGRRRDFFGKPDYEMFNEAISQLPQATVSDQIKFSLPMLEAAAPWAFFNYEGHDALMAEIEPQRLEEYSKIFHEVVERPIDFRNCSLPRDFDLIIPAELSYSDSSWQDMKEVKF